MGAMAKRNAAMNQLVEYVFILGATVKLCLSVCCSLGLQISFCVAPEGALMFGRHIIPMARAMGYYYKFRPLRGLILITTIRGAPFFA